MAKKKSEGKHLMIVESPAKAKTLEKFLDKNYVVRSSYGHIRDLPTGDFGVDVKKGYKPKYVISPDKEQVVKEGYTRIEFRCSPYHQNSALYPIIDHLQRLLQFAQDDAPQAKLAKLQQSLVTYRFPQADTLPLLAALLSLPSPSRASSSASARVLNTAGKNSRRWRC
jgi:hypothetical protein